MADLVIEREILSCWAEYLGRLARMLAKDQPG